MFDATLPPINIFNSDFINKVFMPVIKMQLVTKSLNAACDEVKSYSMENEIISYTQMINFSLEPFNKSLFKYREALGTYLQKESLSQSV